MSAKARSDSLYARCTPEQREELFVFLVEQGGGYARALEMLESWGLRSSLGSLSAFVQRHGMDWRLRRAAELAADAEGKLPKGWERQRKLALAQKEFELAFRDLSLEEYVALERLELDKTSARFKGRIEAGKLKLSREKFERETCETFLRWYGERRAREIADGPGTNDEKIAALRAEYFRDVEALEKSGDFRLPE